MGWRTATLLPPTYGVPRMDEEQRKAMNTNAIGARVINSPAAPSLSELSAMLPAHKNSNARIYPDYADDISSSSYRKNMIGMRLRVPPGAMFPFDALETHYAGEKVFIFVAVDDKPVVLEDESALFPSDALVTQLRLIQK